MTRANHLAFPRLDADRPATLHDDPCRLGQQTDVAAARAHGGFQRPGERRAAAARQLRLGRTGDQRGDMVAEAPHAHVDLAQSIEEQQAGHHRRVLELPLHELERRQSADVEQPAARRCAFEQRAALVRRQRWRAMLRSQDVGDDRHELVVPAAQRLGIAAVELRDRGDGPFDVRPPLERPAVAGEQRDVELRLDVARAVAFEIEIRVPRHRRDRPLEERVRVVQEAGLTWVFERGETAAGDRRTIDGKHSQAGLAEIGRQDQRVVPGAKDDSVVVACGSRGRGAVHIPPCDTRSSPTAAPAGNTYDIDSDWTKP